MITWDDIKFWFLRRFSRNRLRYTSRIQREVGSTFRVHISDRTTLNLQYLGEGMVRIVSCEITE